MVHDLEAERPDDYLTRLALSDLGRAYKSLVMDELDIEPGASVVDLGCGPGADLAGLANAVGPTGRVLGIDIDAAAVAEARRSVSPHANVHVQQGDIHRLDLADRSVDRVHTDRVLQHVADPGAVVAEVARVLRPGGIAGFAEPDWDTFVIDHSDPEIAAAYRRFITDAVVRNSRIGRQLPALCEAHGLDARRIVPVTAVFRDLAEADRIFGFERVSRRAVVAGYLTDTQAAALLDHLSNEPLFASVTLFLTLAQAAPGQP
ncbi:MAG: methyltransferase domain-containing protein [Nocardioides sp.]